MTAKDLFIRDKELFGKWSGFINGPDASRVFAIADATLVNEATLTPEIIRGAKIYRRILETLCEEDDPEMPIPHSGLVHDIDPKPRTRESVKRKAK